MIEKIILLTLATSPVLLLLFFVYQKDKYEKEPFGMLLKTFLLGCLSALPAIFMEEFLSSLYDGSLFSRMPPAFSGIYEGFVVAGLSEELCKLLFLFIAVWGSKHFTEYFDGVVYAVFVSLGFAAVENVMYVFSESGFLSSIMTGSMRAVLSVPAHFLFGVAMGYWFALAKFTPSKRAEYLGLAFIIPILLHGTFDSLLMVPGALGDGSTWLSLLLLPAFIFFDIKLWKSGIRRLKEMQRMTAVQHGDEEEAPPPNEEHGEQSQGSNNNTKGDPFTGFNWDVK